jgi:RNA polymerase sigma factor (sigma-70 family)
VSGATAYGIPDEGDVWDLKSLSPAQHQALRKELVCHLVGFRFLSEATRHEVADDAVVQVLSSGRLDPARAPMAYLKKTARRLATKASKRYRVEELVEDQRVLEEEAHDEGADPLAYSQDDEELLGWIHAAIDALPARQMREVAVLRSQNVSAAETGRRLGISRNQVDQQWSRGRGRVRAVPEIKDRLRTAHVKRDAHPKDGM